MTAAANEIHPNKQVTVFINCRLLRNHELVNDELWIEGNTIIDPRTVGRKGDRVIDCRNAIISPGWIDLQVNGAFGIDFVTHENVEEGVALVNKRMPATGVTSYCPTLITSPPEYFHRTIPRIARTAGSAESGAGVLGIHVEGPFISLAKKGAHPPECIVDFKGKGYKAVEAMYGDVSNVAIVTLAPEHEGAPEVVRELTKRGITVSLGHTSCTHEQALAAVQAGARKLTHLFNAMPAFHHRDPSLPGLLVSDYKDQIYYGIIADGIHTHYTALRLAYRMHPEGLCLVTDALMPMGLPRGDYVLGKQPITVFGEPRRAVVKGTDTLCGVVAPLGYCVKHFRDVTGCSLAFALETVTLHPARCMRITDKKGTLDYGSDADFVLIDNDFNVKQTWIAGELAFDEKLHPELVVADF